jgi:short-subunit dehydrogenase
VARELTARGWHCVLLARTEERLRRLAEELGAEHEVCDVSDRAEVERVAAVVRERHPAVALLVNNAGIPGRQSFLDIEPDRLEQLVRTNYLGGIWCLRAFLPALEAAAPSDLVNVVSVAGFVTGRRAGPYCASKFAQLAFSRSAAAELATRGIRVHTVNPGFVETEGFPQRELMTNPVWRRLVVGPDVVGRHVVEAVERGRRETFVPGWYRLGALVQGVAPGLLARLASSRAAPHS